MSQYQVDSLINIVLQGFSLALLVVLVMGLVRRRPVEKRRMLMAATQLLLNGVACALAARILGLLDLQGQLSHIALWVTVTGSYVFGTLTFLAITIYACTDSVVYPEGGLHEDHLKLALWTLNCCGLVLILTNPITHAVFVIGPDSRAHPGGFGWLIDLMVSAEAALIIMATLRLRGQGSPYMLAKQGVSGLLVLVGTVVSIAYPRISLIFPSLALMLTMLSVGVQAMLDEQLTQAQMEATESRMRLLSGQIHPHFIFNSLNAIKALIVEDPEQAERAVQDFSDYLRSHLDVMSDSRLVPFSEEMEHVRHYVALEMADPTCPMDVSYDFETEDFLVPPLTVQPLVENAIRHGIRTHEGGGWVRVLTREFDDRIGIVVEGSGEGASSVTERQYERRRVGLENVRERIERQCGGKIEKSFGQDGSVVIIELPKGE